jgi:hypothetical protein
MKEKEEKQKKREKTTNLKACHSLTHDTFSSSIELVMKCQCLIREEMYCSPVICKP